MGESVCVLLGSVVICGGCMGVRESLCWIAL